MSNEITIISQGESLPFQFDRGGQSIENFVCTIEVKMIPSDVSSITRVITPVDDAWPGFLTSTETSALSLGLYRLLGILTNSSTDEEEQVTQTTRFKVGDSWAT